MLITSDKHLCKYILNGCKVLHRTVLKILLTFSETTEKRELYLYVYIERERDICTKTLGHSHDMLSRHPSHNVFIHLNTFFNY